MTSRTSSASERRARIAQELRETTGIDEAMIERLVQRFYARAREDALLGPVFAARVTDWDAHLARLCAFWSSVVLMTGAYRGQPMPLHMVLPIDSRHFGRWLALFETTACEICPPAAAERFIDRARRIASCLEAETLKYQADAAQGKGGSAVGALEVTSDTGEPG